MCTRGVVAWRWHTQLIRSDLRLAVLSHSMRAGQVQVLGEEGPQGTVHRSIALLLVTCIFLPARACMGRVHEAVSLSWTRGDQAKSPPIVHSPRYTKTQEHPEEQDAREKSVIDINGIY